MKRQLLNALALAILAAGGTALASRPALAQEVLPRCCSNAGGDSCCGARGCEATIQGCEAW